MESIVPRYRHPFWNEPATEADARLYPEGLVLPGQVPDPETFEAAGWTVSADGSTMTPPPHLEASAGEEPPCGYPWSDETGEHRCVLSSNWDHRLHRSADGARCESPVPTFMGSSTLLVGANDLSPEDLAYFTRPRPPQVIQPDSVKEPAPTGPGVEWVVSLDHPPPDDAERPPRWTARQLKDGQHTGVDIGSEHYDLVAHHLTSLGLTKQVDGTEERWS